MALIAADGPPRPALPALGANAALNGMAVFPPSDAWNKDVTRIPVDPKSAALIAAIGLDRPLHPDFGTTWEGQPFGIPYVVVAGSQAKVPVTFEYADESDPGPYPIPPDAPVEGGPQSQGDRHVLLVDRDDQMLYELCGAVPLDGGRRWKAVSGAIFDLRESPVRPAGWTSADAAGLPVFAGLVRYDEVAAGEIHHALRFTVRKTRRAYVAPATHWASKARDENLPPMGMRVRLRADFDVTAFPPSAQVILRALKRYGMIVADNGGDWFLSGAPDPRWNDNDLQTLKRITGKDFEVVRMGTVVE